MLNSPCTLLFSFFPFYSPFSLLCSNFPPPLSKFVYFRSLSSLPFLCVHIPSTRGECFLANRSRLVFLEWYRMVNGKYYFMKSICYSGRQVRTLLPSCGALTLYAANTWYHLFYPAPPSLSSSASDLTSLWQFFSCLYNMLTLSLKKKRSLIWLDDRFEPLSGGQILPVWLDNRSEP